MTSLALKALRSLQKAEETKAKETPAPAELVAVPGFRTVEEMTLEAFSRAGLVVRVKSRLLEEEVLFVSDDVKALDARDGLAVYRAEELVHLVHLPAEAVRKVHRLKKLFSGIVTDGKHEEVDR